LEIAQKHQGDQSDMDLVQRVLQERQRYLKALHREEWDVLYLSYAIKEDNSSD